MKLKNKKRGFTLIELTLYMGLISILLVIVMELFATIFHLRSESEANSAVVQDSRYLLTRLAYDLNRAKSIDVPANIGQTSSTLQLTVNEDNEDNVYTYFLDSGMLSMSNHLGTNILNSISTTVDPNLSFTRIGNGFTSGKDTIQLSISVRSVTQKSPGINEIESFTTILGTR